MNASSFGIKIIYNASKILFISIVILMIFSSLLSLLAPYMLKLMIDALVNKNQTRNMIYLIVIGYVIVKTLIIGFYDLTSYFQRLASLKNEIIINKSLIEKISSLDYQYFDDPKYYDILRQTSRGTFAFIDLFIYFANIIAAIAYVIFSIVIIIKYNLYGLLGLTILAILPSLFIGIKKSDLEWTAFSSSSPINKKAGYYKYLLINNRTALKEMKIFKLSSYFSKKFLKLVRSYYQIQKITIMKTFSYEFVALIWRTILFGAILLILVNNYLSNLISVGTLTFLLYMFLDLRANINWGIRTFNKIVSTSILIYPIYQVFGFKPKLKETKKPRKFPKEIKKGIEFKNVTFSYPGSKEKIFNKFNLFIKAKQNVSIVGDNGAGKTTLIKLLTRLYDVDSGEVLIDGINIKDFRKDDLYANIGIIFQDFMKYEGLVEENIKFGNVSKRNSKEKLKKAASYSQASKFISKLKKQYKTHIGKTLNEQGIDLSHGQWQKIALSRAFFKDSPILVLDEPTSAIDPKSEYDIFKTLKKYGKNKITFTISHRYSTVKDSDLILVIKDGKVIEKGNHKELMQKKKVYYKLFKLQAKAYNENEK